MPILTFNIFKKIKNKDLQKKYKYKQDECCYTYYLFLKLRLIKFFYIKIIQIDSK